MTDNTDPLGLPLEEKDKSEYEKKAGLLQSWIQGEYSYKRLTDFRVWMEQAFLEDLEFWWEHPTTRGIFKTLKYHHVDSIKKEWSGHIKMLRGDTNEREKRTEKARQLKSQRRIR